MFKRCLKVMGGDIRFFCSKVKDVIGGIIAWVVVLTFVASMMLTVSFLLVTVILYVYWLTSGQEQLMLEKVMSALNTSQYVGLVFLTTGLIIWVDRIYRKVKHMNV